MLHVNLQWILSYRTMLYVGSWGSGGEGWRSCVRVSARTSGCRLHHGVMLEWGRGVGWGINVHGNLYTLCYRCRPQEMLYILSLGLGALGCGINAYVSTLHRQRFLYVTDVS